MKEKIVYNITVNTKETTKYSRVFEFKTFWELQQQDNAISMKNYLSTAQNPFTETISYIEAKIVKPNDPKFR